ncbi:hypothetical protein TNIN_123161 [Trichonephila inaurata madagascariensis]|uniref:Uncharacterized protein n=1 Tax=Trichonephila inaurata madagascariensis TaxID=2747483 RepID=A0A8X7C271_9ARAC|nr:hypothetical protein TNIN_123161 [Trichonephila inaurata madagascariensis]
MKSLFEAEATSSSIHWGLCLWDLTEYLHSPIITTIISKTLPSAPSEIEIRVNSSNLPRANQRQRSSQRTPKEGGPADSVAPELINIVQGNFCSYRCPPTVHLKMPPRSQDTQEERSGQNG